MIALWRVNTVWHLRRRSWPVLSTCVCGIDSRMTLPRRLTRVSLLPPLSNTFVCAVVCSFLVCTPVTCCSQSVPIGRPAGESANRLGFVLLSRADFPCISVITTAKNRARCVHSMSFISRRAQIDTQNAFLCFLLSHSTFSAHFCEYSRQLCLFLDFGSRFVLSHNHSSFKSYKVCVACQPTPRPSLLTKARDLKEIA